MKLLAVIVLAELQFEKQPFGKVGDVRNTFRSPNTKVCVISEARCSSLANVGLERQPQFRPKQTRVMKLASDLVTTLTEAMNENYVNRRSILRLVKNIESPIRPMEVQ